MHQIPERSAPTLAHKILTLSGIVWFCVAAIGQFIFVYYIVAAYVPVLAVEGLLGMANTPLPYGYVERDFLGNIAIAFHVVIAIVIVGGGVLQLTPAIRNHFPVVHRWLGRTYVVLAILTSLAGLHLVWTRGVSGGVFAPYAIAIVGILIIIFALIAITCAIKRQFDCHRRWAMRLFMVSSAVWFFRVWLMFWFMTTGGIGIDPETFTGPFITFTYFAQFVVPLSLLQFYFLAQDSPGSGTKYAASFTIGAATVATAIGIFAATMGMWLPATLP